MMNILDLLAKLIDVSVFDFYFSTVYILCN